MSNPFKVGDRVRCIDGCAGEMTDGSIHTVVSTNEDFVGFKDNIADWFYERYELIEAAPNPKETGCFIVVTRDSTGMISSSSSVSGQFETLEESAKYAEDAALFTPMDFIVFRAVKGFTRSIKEIQV